MVLLLLSTTTTTPTRSAYTAAAVVALVSGYMLLFGSRSRAQATHRRIVHGNSKLNAFVADVRSSPHVHLRVRFHHVATRCRRI